MPSRVRRLYDLEIDEVSLVDRPANQHGRVAIAKRAEEPAMGTFIDADGYEVDESEIEYGETVIDPDTGQSFYMATPEEVEELGYVDPQADDGGTAYDDLDDDDDYEFEEDDDRELAGVGKAFSVGGNGVARQTGQLARRTRRGAAIGRARGAGQNARAAGKEWASAGVGNRARRAAGNAPGRAGRVGGRVSRNSAVRAGAGGAAVGAGGGYASGRKQNASKSLGQSVLEELSKALDNGDRDEVISKMGDMIEDANRSAAQAWRIAKSVQAQQEERDYAALAETYELPVDPATFGGILRDVSKALDPQQLAVLDRVLSASSVGFDELGYGGTSESDVMGQVYAIAQEAVGKSDSLTEAQAVTALFEANPTAYDEYCAESA